MSDIDPQHIDAVAQAIVDAIRFHTGLADADVMWNYSIVKAAGIESEALLESTDPAVHAAMLDALTRHGVLGERFAIQDECGDIWLDCHGDDDEAVAMGQEYASRQAVERIVGRPHEDVVRRLVTAWEVTR